MCTIGRALFCQRSRGGMVINRVLIGGGLMIALAALPFFATPSEAAVRSTRGTVTVVVANANRASGPVCLSLRDLTVGMVVGSICDGDDLDLNVRSGVIRLDLPRRSFVIDANAPGTSVARIVPSTFDLGGTQLVIVQLSRK